VDVEELEDQETAVEASSQIEKSKQTVKHFEALIRSKNRTTALASGLLKPAISGMTTPDSKMASSGFATPTVNPGQSQNETETETDDEDKIMKELSVNEAIDAELSFKMASLVENEKKLE
jgi:hypothetical protein